MKTASLLVLVMSSALIAACSSTGDDSGAAAGNGAGGNLGSGLNSSALPGSETPAAQKQELTQQVGDTVHFGYDSSDVTAEDKSVLQRQAAYMQKYPNLTFSIEGHCDERGTREYNLGLGERRANAVKNILVSLGVNEQRLQTISYGKERPVAVGSTESSWAQNRRGVTVIN